MEQIVVSTYVYERYWFLGSMLLVTSLYIILIEELQEIPRVIPSTFDDNKYRYGLSSHTPARNSSI